MKVKWNRHKAARNIADHGVSFAEAVTVFDDPLADIEPERTHSFDESRFLAFGTSKQGRLLLVVFTERGNIIRIISAREVTPRERRNYELHH